VGRKASKPDAVQRGNDKWRGIRKSPAKKNIFESQINGLWRDPNKSRRNKDAPPADYLQKVIRIGLEHVPTKLHDFVDKDMLQTIKLARILFGEVTPLRREAR